MSKHSPSQIKHHMEVIDAEWKAKQDALQTQPPIDAISRGQFQRRIVTLRQAYGYWSNEYRKLTGHGPNVVRAKTFTQMENEEKEKKRVQAQRRKRLRNAKSSLASQIETVSNSLGLLQIRLNSARKHAADHWVRAFLVHQAGGVSFMNTWLIDKQVSPKAEQQLKLARQALAANNLVQANAHMVEAARWINQGGGALHEYEKALGIGVKRFEITVKVSAGIMTGVVGSAASLSSAGTVGVEMFGAGAGEVATIGAEWLSGGKVGEKQITDAVVNTLVAGGTAAVGEFGKNMLSKPIADLLYKGKATKGQLKMVEDAVSGYYSANSKELIEAVKQIRDGKKPTYNWWAGVLAPVINATAPGLKAPTQAMSEKEVRDELMKKK